MTSLYRAANALQHNRLREAEQCLRRVLQQDPGDAEGNRLMGMLCAMRGKTHEAVERLEHALASNPDDPIVNMTLGSVLMEAGDIYRGLPYLRRSSELAPHDPAAWFNMGTALRQAGHYAAAREALARAVTLAPKNTEMYRALATVLTDIGEIDNAADILRKIIRQQPSNAKAWNDLANLKTVPMTRLEALQLGALAHDSSIPELTRVPLMFALAKALEDQRGYAEAFDMYEQANSTARQFITWDRKAEEDRIDGIARAFHDLAFNHVDPRKGEGIILIVHVPRSGSTLLEQMLASHGAIAGGGETRILPDLLEGESTRRNTPFPEWVADATSEDWSRLGNIYLNKITAYRSGMEYITDKTPWNWAFVGAALAMLPAARIINVSRDPLETCFSCYRQLFSSGCLFTYDVDDLVAYYAGYERLQCLWRRKFPTRYIDCRYEKLQQSPELEIRRILDFCDLPFDHACMEFYYTQRPVHTLSAAQIRQKVRRDTARLPRYGEKLNFFREKLASVGLNGH